MNKIKAQLSCGCMIMQSNMKMKNHTMSCNIRWMLHDNVSQNGYGNAIIGSYGGFFEEIIMGLMGGRASHLTGLGCTCEVYTNCMDEKGKCTVLKTLGKY